MGRGMGRGMVRGVKNRRRGKANGKLKASKRQNTSDAVVQEVIEGTMQARGHLCER